MGKLQYRGIDSDCRRQWRRTRGDKLKHICDFSRGGLNIRLGACIQTLLRDRKYALFISLSSILLPAAN